MDDNVVGDLFKFNEDKKDRFPCMVLASMAYVSNCISDY